MPFPVWLWAVVGDAKEMLRVVKLQEM